MKGVEASITKLSKMGYTSYGVEMPSDLQPALDVFVQKYKETRNIKLARAAFWEKATEIYLANPTSVGATNPENVRELGLEKFLNSKDDGSPGFMNPLFDRIALATDKGLATYAIDAPMSTIIPHGEQLYSMAQAGSTDSQIRQFVSSRNGAIASNLRPGMIAEVGAFHTGGVGSIEALSAANGLPAVSFDVYGSRLNNALSFESAGVPVLNSSPGAGFLKGLIGGM
jgi:hypothetical protein